MTQLQFKDAPPTQMGGWYWMKHKDSDDAVVAHLTEERGRRVMLFESIELSEENFIHYVFAGPLQPPGEQPLGVQMAMEADDNRLLTPREMVLATLAAIDDPDDFLHKANKAIFIGLYAGKGHYTSATLRCNLNNSEAVALLTVKANEFCREISGEIGPDHDSPVP